MNFLPDLATSTPLWLAMTTVGVNAIVGALRASIDDERHWDIVGLSTFGVLMGLGGGFIRDLLVGNLPVESLRTPWLLATVLGAIVIVLLLGQQLARINFLVRLLNALALGLFAISGVAYALRADLASDLCNFRRRCLYSWWRCARVSNERRSTSNLANKCAKCARCTFSFGCLRGN